MNNDDFSAPVPDDPYGKKWDAYRTWSVTTATVQPDLVLRRSYLEGIGLSSLTVLQVID